MTERAQPGAQGSTLRNVEAGETANSLHDGFIVPSSDPTLSAQRYAGLDETQFNEFNASYGGGSLDVTIDPGEAFVNGWLATDQSYTVTLDSFTDGQTVVVAWDADAVYDDSIHSDREDADRVIVSRETDLPTLQVPYISLWELDTDGDGVTSATDLRNIGRTVQDTKVGSLSAKDGDTIDMSSDSFENAGHDEVRVPQVRNLTVADWEEGTLDTDVWSGDTGNFSVQSSTVESGSYALEGSGGSSGQSNIESSNLSAMPQKGDKFRTSFYLTGSKDKPWIVFAINQGITTNSYYLGINVSGDEIDFGKRSDNSTVKSNISSIPFSSNLNTWITMTVEWGENSLDAEISTSNSVLGTVSLSDGEYESGSVGFRARNFSNGYTQYFDSFKVTRRTPDYLSDTRKGTTELGNDVQPSGEISTGPQAAPDDALRAKYAEAPVTTESTQGAESILTLLESADNPSVILRRILDGEGGSYANQLDGALGRFARLNANLSWEYDSLADVPNWNSNDDGGDASWTYNVNSTPRRIHLESDGSNTSNEEYEGIASSVLTTYSSLDEFKITFSDVSFTNNSDDNQPFVGLADDDVSSPLSNGFYAVWNLSLSPTDRLIVTDGSGFNDDKFDNNLDWDKNHDISIAYGGNTVSLYADGVLQASLNTSFRPTFKPVLQLNMSDNNEKKETLEVEQVTVEPLPEVLQ